MNLEQLFEVWYNTQTDNKEICDAWKTLEIYLHENCSESIHEQISEYAMDFVRQAEKFAYISGFTHAIRLFIDIQRQ